MKTANRWPHHPRPLPGEALSSWVGRLASIYDHSSTSLFREALDMEPVREIVLDSNPPDTVVDALFGHTGFDPKSIRSMTFGSWVPSLIDQLTADYEGSAFNDYVHLYSVLLPPARSTGRRIIDWTAWTSPEIFKDPLVCRQCLDTEQQPYLRLHWRTCAVATCPIHKTYLLTTTEAKNENLLGGKRRLPEQAPTSLLRLDAMTLDAIKGKDLVFNGAKISAGTWLRLLRTVLDELSTVMISAAADCDALRSVWQQAGVTTRVRSINWMPFEHLAASERRTHLLAAATAFEMIAARKLTPTGEDVKVVLGEKKKSKTKAIAERRKPSVDARLAKQRTRAKGAFDWAKRDPKGAKYVRQVLMSADQDELKGVFIDYALTELGIDPGLVITDGMSIGVDKEALSHWQGRRIYPRH